MCVSHYNTTHACLVNWRPTTCKLILRLTLALSEPCDTIHHAFKITMYNVSIVVFRCFNVLLFVNYHSVSYTARVSQTILSQQRLSCCERVNNMCVCVLHIANRRANTFPTLFTEKKFFMLSIFKTCPLNRHVYCQLLLHS